jgi:hypothetical protein
MIGCALCAVKEGAKLMKILPEASFYNITLAIVLMSLIGIMTLAYSLH